jgi:chemotaxis protein MotB
MISPPITEQIPRGEATLNARLLLALAAPLALAACVVPRQVAEQREADVAACLSELDETIEQNLVMEQQLGRICPASGGNFDGCIGQLDRLQDELASCRVAVRKQQQAEKAPPAFSAGLAEREAELKLRLEADITSQSVEVAREEQQLAVRVLDSILFESGEAVIRPGGQAVLDRLAPVLISGQNYVRIEGHTDDIPIGPRLNTRFYSNWELSAARAAAVVRYLQNRHGLPPERMEAVGRGQYDPTAPGDTPEGRQRNRRLEIVLRDAS